LDAIERAIRSALEKGNASDRAFRERVYRQAFAALERALQANPGVTVEAAIRRRKGLQAKITEIEAAYLPAAPTLPEAPVAAPVSDELPDFRLERDAPRADAAPEISVAAPATPQQIAPTRFSTGASAAPSEPPIRVAPEIEVRTHSGPTPVVPDIMLETRAEAPAVRDVAPTGKPPRRQRPLAAMFFGVMLLCVAAMGIWWAMQTGLIGGGSTEPDLSDIEQPAADSEDFEPGSEGAPVLPGAVDPQRNWIAVFSPADPSTVSAPGDAKADSMQDPGGSFIRIRSGASGAAVLFDIGQGVLEQIAGKRATFDIVARAEDGKDTQMSVLCNFGELGDCGRKRYAVGAARADYLFEIDVPKGEPGAGGTIAINSDFSNGGKAVDVFEVKVSVAE
jgi:hypothetical protein